MPGVEKTPIKFGSPSFPAYGYDLQLLREADASEAGADEKAVVAIVPPLPPGCMSTVWGDDERFVKTYFSTFAKKLVYSTFDWGIRDKDGYYFILGRTDDVINVAGHRLGTREIEEAVNMHPEHRRVRGGRRGRPAQGPDAARVCRGEGSGAHRHARTARSTEKEVMETVDKQLGAIARPERGALRDAAAEDALGQDAAPLDPGAGRRARSGRPDHDRGSRRAGADPGQAAAMKTRPELTLEDCEKIAAAAEAEARRNNWNVSIAILDDGGHLLHFARMDGATPATAAIAWRKARTAAVSRRSSGMWEERIKRAAPRC